MNKILDKIKFLWEKVFPPSSEEIERRRVEQVSKYLSHSSKANTMIDALPKDPKEAYNNRLEAMRIRMAEEEKLRNSQS